jgi:1-deoxy-D-xylulose-5-phosphate reductoisomerase
VADRAPTTVSLVGSTGSIGTQAVDVIEGEPGRYHLAAIGAARSVDRLIAQAWRLRPERVAIADATLAGPEALTEISTGVDVVVNGVVGFAGLPVTLAALGDGRRLALANKESLIAGGPVVQAARATPGAEIVPVDSEHCAVHQCLRALLGREGMSALPNPPANPLKRIVLTASGGPFRGRSRPSLGEVTVADALKHPTWSMGPKITIDSSTLMNKGLEVIEAHLLFGVAYDDIDVVSAPDMRLPIGYALAYPDRSRVSFGGLDWTTGFLLEFLPPDREAFPCLDLAYRAGRLGGTAPACINGANEVAVDAFLAEQIRWVDIPDIIAAALDDYSVVEPGTVNDVLEADQAGRDLAGAAVRRLAR